MPTWGLFLPSACNFAPAYKVCTVSRLLRGGVAYYPKNPKNPKKCAPRCDHHAPAQRRPNPPTGCLQSATAGTSTTGSRSAASPTTPRELPRVCPFMLCACWWPWGLPRFVWPFLISWLYRCEQCSHKLVAKSKSLIACCCECQWMSVIVTTNTAAPAAV